MTLITIGLDEVLLLRQLRRRLAYVEQRIAILRPSVRSDNVAASFGASGAMDALTNEYAWLQGLILSVQGVEHED